MVRFENKRGGPCAVLGRVVKVTERYVYYKPNLHGSVSYVPIRHVHMEPCRNCNDHPNTRYPDPEK
jgi:hypothetical protein